MDAPLSALPEIPKEIGLATRYIDLGACVAIAGMPAQAAALYQRALLVDPDNALARRALRALDRRCAEKLCQTHTP
ncbi:hypothetical protein CCAX7_006680 [Capsulimonas corticalis]|uniref:Uncharacterized protein n=1 Tax=Capsulimonas corticalis TaxID=2219043 RepID=A0A402D1F7_9BACT|nr:hypothetical protein [Capsulimonas corticalis]BDI28617.1 hypothetical protein CCAX7_006680 [Capsulimonas corticalis]